MLPLALKSALTAGYIFASTGCLSTPRMKETDIAMTFTHAPPVVENNTPSEDLSKYNISTTFSRSRNETFTVGGLHLSEFAPTFLIDYYVETLPNGNACIAPAFVNITVNYAPRVLIASEHTRETCMYWKILEHEMRHVNIDIITFKELLPRLKQGVLKAVLDLQPMGPMPASSLDKAKDILTDKVRAALVFEVDEIEQIRLNRQQQIDTRQEYLRVANSCNRP